MDKKTILVVDDEKEIAKLIEIYLTNEGYNVLKAANGIEALKIIEEHNIDLLILDVMMPGMGGLEVCMRIRQDKNMPIIMLSAKSEDMDKIMGLTTGADDYMAKPFNPLELIARVKSQLRRYTKLNNNGRDEKKGILEIDDLSIDEINHVVKVEDKEVSLTPREFDILLMLARNSGQVFSSERIYETVWKEDCYDGANTVMVHIRKIREKIEKDSRKPRYIKTVWGVGYKIEKA